MDSNTFDKIMRTTLKASKNRYNNNKYQLRKNNNNQ